MTYEYANPAGDRRMIEAPMSAPPPHAVLICKKTGNWTPVPDPDEQPGWVAPMVYRRVYSVMGHVRWQHESWSKPGSLGPKGTR